MNLDSAALRQVFDALDGQKRGYITVEKFTDALEKFYTSANTTNTDEHQTPSLTRMHSLDVHNIVEALDPQNDGIISFEDFESAFQNFFNCQSQEELKNKTMTINLRGRKVSIKPENYVLSSPGDGELDLRTEDSGFMEPVVSETPPVRPTNLVNSHSINSNHDQIGSPFSGSRSDLMLDDVDSNFEQIRNQISQMEAKMESISSHSGKAACDNIAKRLREENTRLSASVAVLEERLKEAELRYKRDLDSERVHLESLLTRSKRTYEQEIEGLRMRLQKVEAEFSETSIQFSKTRIELDGARAEHKRTSDALLDAQDRINHLSEQLNNRTEAANWELKKAINDRDQALNALKQVNTAVGGKSPSRQVSADTVARLEEMQQIIHRLKEENKNLTQQVQDAMEESWFNNVRDGHKLLVATENSIGAEFDTMTKEEVVDLLTQEKHGNNLLRDYLNTLLAKVIERNPDILETVE